MDTVTEITPKPFDLSTLKVIEFFFNPQTGESTLHIGSRIDNGFYVIYITKQGFQTPTIGKELTTEEIMSLWRFADAFLTEISNANPDPKSSPAPAAT